MTTYANSKKCKNCLRSTYIRRIMLKRAFWGKYFDKTLWKCRKWKKKTQKVWYTSMGKAFIFLLKCIIKSYKWTFIEDTLLVQERTRKILFSNEFYNSQNFLTFFRICECQYTVCEMTQYNTAEFIENTKLYVQYICTALR